MRVVPQVGTFEPRHVAFSPIYNERLLVVEASGRVGVWDVSNPSAPTLFASIPAGAYTASFAPDGASVITIGFDGRVREWTPDGHLRWISKGGHAGAARALAVGSDLIVTGGDDALVRVWRRDGSPAGEPLSGHRAAVVSVDISKHGEIVSVAGEGSVRLWKPGGDGTYPHEGAILFQQKKPQPPETFASMLRYDLNWRWHHSVGFAPDGSVIGAAVFDGALRFLNPDGSLRHEIPRAHDARHIRALAFSPAGDLMASAGFDGAVRLWNLDGSPRRAAFIAHFAIAFSVSFSADGQRLATAGGDNQVQLWNIDGTRFCQLPQGLREQIATVAVAREELAVAVASGGTITMWGPDAKARGMTPQRDTGNVLSLAFAARGDILASGGLGSVRLWNADGSPRGQPFTWNPRVVRALAFAPTGTMFAAGNDYLRLLKPGEVLWQAPFVEPDSVTRLAFSPDGELIAIGSELGRIQVWKSDGSARAPAFKLPREYIRALAFAGEGRLFATAGGEESVVRVWKLDLSPVEPPLEGHFGVVRALASTADASVLASGSEDGTVRLWRLPSREPAIIDVGLPVDQLGFCGALLWVRAADNSMFFYDHERRLVATALLQSDNLLIYTPDGWYAGATPRLGAVRLFTESGSPLSEADAASRFSPERVGAALTEASWNPSTP